MTNYILVFFVALSGLFGVLSFHFSNAKAEAESALVQAIDANTAMQKSLNLQVLSCKQDDDAVVKVEAEKKVLQEQIDTVTKQIAALKSGIKKPTKSEVNKNVETNDVLTGPELLSDDLVKLLKQSYCNTEPDSCLPSK